jgi:hypothetical protein
MSMDVPTPQRSDSFARRGIVLVRSVLCTAGAFFLCLAFMPLYLFGGEHVVLAVFSSMLSGLVGFGFVFVGLFRPPSAVVQLVSDWLEGV